MGCSNSKDGSNDSYTPRRRSSLPTDKDAIEGRIEACSEFSSCRVGGAIVRYAYLSQRGYYPDDLSKANQDALSVAHGIGGNEHDALFGVYDGHGREGNLCAQYVKTELPKTFNRIIERAKSRHNSSMLSRKATAVKNMGRADSSSATSYVDLKKEELQRSIHCAHVRCNAELHATEDIDDKLSGTTAITVYFHGPGTRITVANVGDSRAVLGQLRKNAYRALPLSRDQTPYRGDERVRVIKAGARILSLDQIEGLEPITDWEDDLELGDEIDEWGDPPRVWSKDGEYPGTAFTRSLGDLVAEHLGVYAEPEMITKELSAEDKIIVIASDGVFEFLTNQSVIDICAKFQNPLEACRAIVAEAYELWLQYELRTDDITIICIFIDDLVQPDKIPAGDLRRSGAAAMALKNDKSSCEAQNDVLSLDHDLVEEGSKPVRSTATKAMNTFLIKNKVNYEEVDIADLVVEKTPEEKQRISEVIQGNLTFQNISLLQKETLFGVMEKIHVKQGEWVITQGTIGDHFFIVDHGKFEVRVLPDSAATPNTSPEKPEDGGDVVYVYDSTSSSSHPSFGEIALLHSIPRAASVIAQTDGVLWGLHRALFNKIISERSDRKNLQKGLHRNVDALKCLEKSEIEVLSKQAEEVLFQKGDIIVERGDIGNALFFVVHGNCFKTEDGTEFNENKFFGDELLLAKGPYEYTIEASCTTKCLKLSLDACSNDFDLKAKMLVYQQRRSTKNAMKNAA